MWCWMNGTYMKADELSISPFDHGFLYGAGFFETFRTYDGHVFLFEDHWVRLNESLQEFRIAMPYSKSDILEVVQTLVDRNGGADGYFRLNVSAGVHEIGLSPTFYETPTVIVFQKQLPPTTRGHAKKAIWLETIRNSPEGDVRRKSQNFLNSIKGRFELPSLKDTEGIFLNENGYVAEGVTSNVFWVTNGVLYTPSIRTGILPGTTRAFLLTLAAKSGIPVKEGFYGKEDVKHADELFVTNAIQELIPITEINGVRFAGAEGAMYRALHERYVNEVNKAKEGGN